MVGGMGEVAVSAFIPRAWNWEMSSREVPFDTLSWQRLWVWAKSELRPQSTDMPLSLVTFSTPLQ